MLDREYHGFVSALVDRVIDEIGISARHEFADALDVLTTTDSREKSQVLQGTEYRVANREGHGRVAGMQIFRYLG
jgi:hypothetical protein